MSSQEISVLCKSNRYRLLESLFLLQYISNESEIADSVIRFNISCENGLERLLRQNDLVSLVVINSD